MYRVQELVDFNADTASFATPNHDFADPIEPNFLKASDAKQ